MINMGVFRDIAFTGVGYGARLLQDKHNDKKENIKHIQSLDIKDHIDNYINAHGIVEGSIDMKILVRRLRELADYYEYKH